jgi:hypothetical protein
MEKLEKYRKEIQEVLTEFARPRRLGTEKAEEFETQTVFDTVRDHYQVLHVGWENGKRTYGVVIHIDIKNDKLWVQQNWTDFEFIDELMERGIPKNDIVLAFHSPSMRKYTDFAVA